MCTLSSANVTDVNLVLKERTHKIKISIIIIIIIIIIIYYKIVHEVQHHTNITYQDVQIKSIA